MDMEKLYNELIIKDVKNKKTQRAFQMGYLNTELSKNELFEFRKYMAEKHNMQYLTSYNGFKLKELDYMQTEVAAPKTTEEMMAEFLAKKENSVKQLDDSGPEEAEEEVSVAVGLDSKYGGLKFISSTNKYIIEFEFLDKEETVSKSAKGVFNTTYNVYKTSVKTGETLDPIVSREANIDENFKAGKYKPYNEENLALAKEKLSKPTRATKK